MGRHSPLLNNDTLYARAEAAHGPKQPTGRSRPPPHPTLWYTQSPPTPASQHDLALAFSVMLGMALLATVFAFAFLLAASILAAAASILGGGRRGHRRCPTAAWQTSYRPPTLEALEQTSHPNSQAGDVEQNCRTRRCQKTHGPPPVEAPHPGSTSSPTCSRSWSWCVSTLLLAKRPQMLSIIARRLVRCVSRY